MEASATERDGGVDEGRCRPSRILQHPRVSLRMSITMPLCCHSYS